MAASTALALARLDSALAEVLCELDGMNLLADARPSRAPVAAVENGIVASLHAMLDIGDGAAVDLVAAARSELSAHLGQQGYEELSAAIEQFDYELALAVLERGRLTQPAAAQARVNSASSSKASVQSLPQKRRTLSTGLSQYQHEPFGGKLTRDGRDCAAAAGSASESPLSFITLFSIVSKVHPLPAARSIRQARLL